MKNAASTQERLKKYTFAGIYPLYVTKLAKKNRTEEELVEVITWLTGYSKPELDELIVKGITLEEFFEKANINPNAALITGTICGIRVEQIEEPLIRNIRYMDKLVDELAQGRKMEKILRRSVA